MFSRGAVDWNGCFADDLIARIAQGDLRSQPRWSIRLNRNLDRQRGAAQIARAFSGTRVAGAPRLVRSDPHGAPLSGSDQHRPPPPAIVIWGLAAPHPARIIGAAPDRHRDAGFFAFRAPPQRRLK